MIQEEVIKAKKKGKLIDSLKFEQVEIGCFVA
jgi:hypothetical protein